MLCRWESLVGSTWDGTEPTFSYHVDLSALSAAISAAHATGRLWVIICTLLRNGTTRLTRNAVLLMYTRWERRWHRNVEKCFVIDFLTCCCCCYLLVCGQVLLFLLFDVSCRLIDLFFSISPSICVFFEKLSSCFWIHLSCKNDKRRLPLKRCCYPHPLVCAQTFIFIPAFKRKRECKKDTTTAKRCIVYCSLLTMMQFVFTLLITVIFLIINLPQQRSLCS